MTSSKAGGTNSRSRGRPTAYRDEYAEQARKLCRLGATDAELANFFEVSERTLNSWKKRHPEFLQALKAGKAVADAEVAEKLYQRACGYSHEAVKMFQAGGEIISKGYTERYPPDTTAAIFWLKNRRPDLWRDKIEQEHTGKDGGPIQSETTTRVIVVPAKIPAVVETRSIAMNDKDREPS